MSDFDVVLDGTLAPGLDRGQVLQDLSQLFGRPVEALEPLLAGRPITIKRNVDAATAERYVRRLQAIGVPARVVAATLELDAEALAPPAEPLRRTTAGAPPPPSSTAAPRRPELGDDEPLWTAICGPKKAHYYVPRWQRYHRGESTFPSWHWPACFVPFWWGLYRKAWAGAVVLGLVLPWVLWVAHDLLTAGKSEVTGPSVLLVFAATIVLPAMLANGFYYRKARKLLGRAQAQSADPTVQLAYLQANGGTSNVGLTVAIVVGALFGAGLLTAIALPAYQDYRTRAQVVEVLAATTELKTQVADHYLATGELAEPSYETVKSSSAAPYIKDIQLTERGAIVVTFAQGPIEDMRLAWVPSRSGSGIVWKCKTVDIPAKFVPGACRE